MSFAEKSAAVFKRAVFVRFWVMITGVIIARILGSVNIGIWFILLMIPSYAEPFGRLKFDVASVYFIGKKKYGLGEVYFNLVVVSLLSSCAIISLFFWQREFIFVKLLKGELPAEYFVYLMFVCIPLRFIAVNYSYLFLSKEDIKAYNRFAIIEPLVFSLLSLVFLIALKWGLFSLVISKVVSGVAAISYGVWKLSRTEKMVPRLNIKMLKDFLNFGSRLYLAGIVSYFHIYAAGLIVALYLLPSAVTFFKMGQDKALLPTLFSSAIGTILYPVVAKSNGIRGDDIAAKACRMVFFLLMIFSVIGAILIKPAVWFLYGREFLPQVVPFWIILPGVIFFGAGSVLLEHFIGRGRAGLVLKISFVPMVLQIALCVILIPSFGILGASFATSFTYLITGLITIVVFAKNTSLPVTDIIIPKKSDVISFLTFLKKHRWQNII